MSDPFGPELSDLIVDYDPETLVRRPVAKAAILARLEAEGRAKPLAIARRLTEREGVLDEAEVDGVLLRSHLELQRLHEEFRVGATVRELLVPLLDALRAATDERPLRVADLGCGLGYIVRWLARHGELGEDIELIGLDYNRALLTAGRWLAQDEGLRCRFASENAFRLRQPAHLVMSTGVLHHFRGDDLSRLFSFHERSAALAFVHVDIRPSLLASMGSFIFHLARMREPLAQWDGYWSAVRAHPAEELQRSALEGAPSFATGWLDRFPGIHALVRIFHAMVGARADVGRELARIYGPLGHRFTSGNSAA